MSTTVTQDTDRRRFVITDDGETAGSSHYRDHDAERIFFHTEIDEAFGGRGLAGTLTSEALATSVAEGFSIVAVCPYVLKWLQTHDHDIDWRKPTPADLTWLQDNLR